MIPLAMELAKLLDLDTGSIVVVGLLSANTGSMLLPFSNPQNIIVWQRYNVSFEEVCFRNDSLFLHSHVAINSLYPINIQIRGKNR
jgi:Na+/H+ antiporter NhaD/arsenite permease-like protein